MVIAPEKLQVLVDLVEQEDPDYVCLIEHKMNPEVQ